MKINVCMHEDTEDIDLAIKSVEEKFGIDFSELYILNSGGNYESLINKPKINSIILEGELTARDLGLGNVYYDTTQNWALQSQLIAEKAAIYIYSDYSRRAIGPDNYVPLAGVKIGDGTSYLIDLPFITDQVSSLILNHLSNTSIHVTQADKTFWNNKVSSYLDGTDLENLVLSKTNYIIQGDIYNG